MEEEKEACFKAGMNDHIAKPIEPARLFGTIKQWVLKERLQELGPSRRTQQKAGRFAGEGLSIAGINTESGLQRVSGNQELYHNLIKNFAMNQPETVRQMAEAVQEGRYETIEKTAHMLRGVAGNIGAVTVQKLCESIEKNAAAVKDIREIEQLFEQLGNEMHKVVRSILENTDLDRQAEMNAEIPENPDMKLEELYKLLEDGDSAAVDSFHLLRGLIRKYTDEKLFSLIEKQIDNYQFEEADIQLKKIMHAGKEGNLS